MPRIIFMTDFTEKYANSLLKGIINYSKGRESWIICKMPLYYREKEGLDKVLEWAKKWKAEAIIGQFYNNEDVGIFKKNKIIAIAQDFKQRFNNIPNITGDYKKAGRMAAKYFIEKEFRHFAFYGFKGVVWSEERCEGFRDELKKEKLDNSFFEFQNTQSKPLWSYDNYQLTKWLLGLPKPIGLFSCDDNQGRLVLEACNICKIKVPEEISVLGVDNDEFTCSLSDPPLSSISLNVEQGGYNVAKLLDNILKGKTIKDMNVYIPPTRIITRQSTETYVCTDKNLAKVIQYIHNHPHDKILVNTLVDLVPMSRRLLEIQFRNTLKQSIYSYILDFKIKKITEDLIYTEDSINDISYRYGFDDAKNLIRLFKDRIGETPSGYRTKHRNENDYTFSLL